MLQDKFLNNPNDLESWSLMWSISFDVCNKAIKTEILKKHLIFYDSEKIYDLSIKATMNVLKRFKKNYKNGLQYRIKKNFVCALILESKHVLYSRTKEQKFYDMFSTNSDLTMINGSVKVINVFNIESSISQKMIDDL